MLRRVVLHPCGNLSNFLLASRYARPTLEYFHHFHDTRFEHQPRRRSSFFFAKLRSASLLSLQPRWSASRRGNRGGQGLTQRVLLYLLLFSLLFSLLLFCVLLRRRRRLRRLRRRLRRFLLHQCCRWSHQSRLPTT